MFSHKKPSEVRLTEQKEPRQNLQCLRPSVHGTYSPSVRHFNNYWFLVSGIDLLLPGVETGQKRHSLIFRSLTV